MAKYKVKPIDANECISNINERIDVLEEKASDYYIHNKMMRYSVMNDIIDEVKYIRSEIIAHQKELVLWHPVATDGLPKYRYDKKYDMPVDYLVTIRGAKLPTVLHCDTAGRWWDEYNNLYTVIAWAEMPLVYKEVKRK